MGVIEYFTGQRATGVSSAGRSRHSGKRIFTHSRSLTCRIRLGCSDDYYFVFLNVTHGVVYSVSERFTILDSTTASANSSAVLAPDASKPTVTVTGSPGPLQVGPFA